MRARTVARVAFAALMAWSASGGIAWAGSFPLRHIRFSQAPAQIQRDLKREFAGCEISSTMMRTSIRIDVGPIGGANRRDYFFELNRPYFRAFFQGDPATTPIPQCDVDEDAGTVWMAAGKGGFKSFTFKDPYFFAKKDEIMFVHEIKPCDCFAFVKWDPEKLAFYQNTGGMSYSAAEKQAEAQGFVAYDYPDYHELSFWTGPF